MKYLIQVEKLGGVLKEPLSMEELEEKEAR